MLNSPAMAKKKRHSPPAAFRKYLRDHLREHYRAIGAKGGKAAAGKGIKKRYAAMTPAERSALAKKAALARWCKAPKQARKKRPSS